MQGVSHRGGADGLRASVVAGCYLLLAGCCLLLAGWSLLIYLSQRRREQINSYLLFFGDKDYMYVTAIAMTTNDYGEPNGV